MPKSGLQFVHSMLFAIIVWGMGTAHAQSSERFVIIGTGGVAAVYYPAGGAICRMVNRNRDQHHIRCLVDSTGGSIDNIQRLRAGNVQFGFAQSDWQYHAYRGSDKFAGKPPFRKLRAVFSLHAEPFTVVARSDANVTRFDDLKGKRINIGNPGSGQRATMEVVMAAKGWDMQTFAHVTELTSTDQSAALCAGEVDAIIMTVGHPSASMQQATTACGGVIVEVSGPKIDSLIEARPYYRRAIIPKRMYNNAKDIATFGVSATVVSSESVPNDVVYAVVKSVFDGIDDFKTLHPALLHLKPDEMVKESISIPLHEGAKRYYREKGLVGRNMK